MFNNTVIDGKRVTKKEANNGMATRLTFEKRLLTQSLDNFHVAFQVLKLSGSDKGDRLHAALLSQYDLVKQYSLNSLEQVTRFIIQVREATDVLKELTKRHEGAK